VSNHRVLSYPDKVYSDLTSLEACMLKCSLRPLSEEHRGSVKKRAGFFDVRQDFYGKCYCFNLGRTIDKISDNGRRYFEYDTYFPHLDTPVLDGSLYDSSSCSTGEYVCGASVCDENHRVENHTCVPCPANSTIEAGDLATSDDTYCECNAGYRDVGENTNDMTCDPIVCAANYRVQNHTCVPCLNNQINDAENIASGGDTDCKCHVGAIKENDICVCPAGWGWDGSKCDECKAEDKRYNNVSSPAVLQGGVCANISCPIGQGFGVDSSVSNNTVIDAHCVSCDGSSFSNNADDGECLPCPSGFISSDDRTSCLLLGCTNSSACNYNASAEADDGSCAIDGKIVADDVDGDGVCNDDEIAGCTTPSACNYNADATDDDGSCAIDGKIVADDVDGDGVCNDDEIAGCTNPSACNYNASATDDDGTCTYVDGICDTCVNGEIIDNDDDDDNICDVDEVHDMPTRFFSPIDFNSPHYRDEFYFTLDGTMYNHTEYYMQENNRVNILNYGQARGLFEFEFRTIYCKCPNGAGVKNTSILDIQRAHVNVDVTTEMIQDVNNVYEIVQREEECRWLHDMVMMESNQTGTFTVSEDIGDRKCHIEFTPSVETTYYKNNPDILQDCYCPNYDLAEGETIFTHNTECTKGSDDSFSNIRVENGGKFSFKHLSRASQVILPENVFVTEGFTHIYNSEDSGKPSVKVTNTNARRYSSGSVRSATYNIDSMTIEEGGTIYSESKMDFQGMNLTLKGKMIGVEQMFIGQDSTIELFRTGAISSSVQNTFILDKIVLNGTLIVPMDASIRVVDENEIYFVNPKDGHLYEDADFTIVGELNDNEHGYVNNGNIIYKNCDGELGEVTTPCDTLFTERYITGEVRLLPKTDIDAECEELSVLNEACEYI
jgi:hypothetical protein